MTEIFLPAEPLQAQIRGLEVLGLDVEALKRDMQQWPPAADGLVPLAAYRYMWQWAHSQYASPTLPTALAAAIPFGAFGMLDYLAGSAHTLGACCESLVSHFRVVSHDTRLELERREDLIWLNVRVDDHVPPDVAEFTLATIAVRLRHVAQQAVAIEQTLLPNLRPSDTAMHVAVFGNGLIYGAPIAAMALQAMHWSLPVQRSDPDLHRTLTILADQLALGQTSTLEQSVRARLRDVLPDGNATPAHLACLLGQSERTLQRRLAEQRLSFSAILDDFRHEEALRLLLGSQLAVVQVAGRLGFSEQSSFTRAFKRWTGTTPAAWRKQQRV